MSIRKIFLLPKIFRPVCMRMIIGDFLSTIFTNTKSNIPNTINSIRLVSNWLLKACKNGKQGIPANGYHLIHGWLPPHPETAGYLIVTLYDLFHFLREKEFRRIALLIGKWECSIQLLDGSFPSKYIKNKPVSLVFDTGQVLQGLLRCYHETKDIKFLEAAKRAGDWLVEKQNQDGAWRHHVYNNIEHTYHTRVAWILLQLYQDTLEEKYKQAGSKNLQWAYSKIDKNFWLQNCSFRRGSGTFTHTLAYAMEGFIEGGIILRESKYIEVAKEMGNRLIEIWNKRGNMPGAFHEGWKVKNGYSCLAGNAQIALCWLKMYQITGSEKYLREAIKLNNFVKSTIIAKSIYEEIVGAVRGSYPIYGDYMHFCFPIWAAKFLLDSLILELKLTNRNTSISITNEK